MNDLYNNYIGQLISSLIDNSEIENNTVLCIKYYNYLDLDRSNIAKVIKNTNSKLLFYTFDSSKFETAFSPVLGWIKELYEQNFSDMELEKFLNECDLYYLHRSIFEKYMNEGICTRKESVIIDEIKYDYNMFIKSLCNILCYISTRVKLILVLNKIQFSSSSTLDFIYEYLINYKSDMLTLILTMDATVETEEYMEENYRKLINKLDDMNCIVELTMKKDECQFDYQNKFVPRIDDFEYYLTSIYNMIMTLSLEQALYYLNIINNNIEINKLDSQNKKIKFYSLYALAYIYSNLNSSALLFCQNLKVLADEVKSDEVYYIYYYLLILSRLSDKNRDLIYYDECLKFALKTKNKENVIRAKLLEYSKYFSDWQILFLSDNNPYFSEEFLKELKQYGYYNHLAYIYGFCLGYTRTDFVRLINDYDNSYFNKSISIAKKIKNDNFILNAYKKNIMIASCFNRYDLISSYYSKCIEIVRKLDNPKEESDINNGLGYNKIISEKYVPANEYFNNSLEILYKISDAEGMSETLYNMAMNAFCAQNYYDAREFLNLVLLIIDKLNMITIRVCNLSKIYGLLAVCNFYLEFDFNCYSYLNKMTSILSHLLDDEKEVDYALWDDDLFLYYFVLGLISKKQNSLDKAREYFDKAEYHIYRSIGSMFYTYPLFTIEKAKLLKKLNLNDERKLCIEKCMTYCRKNNYMNKLLLLSSEYNDMVFKLEIVPLRLQKITKEQIVELVNIVGLEKELTYYKNEVLFLTVWQDMLNMHHESLEELIYTSVQSFKNNFGTDKVIFINTEGEEQKLIYCDSDIGLTSNDINKIIEYFKVNNKEFITSKINSNYVQRKSIIEIFGVNKIFSFAGIPLFSNEKLTNILICYIEVHKNYIENKRMFLENNLSSMKYIFKQLIDAILKYKTQQNLKRINAINERNAVTDLLTGLYNRQGFEKIISGKENFNIDFNLEDRTVILYIDLDNFKYYNDTFGHDIGDNLLIAFSEVFKAAVKNIGFSVRYGGDEFLIGIPKGDKESAIEIAENIYAVIKETNGFEDYLKNKTKKEISIPIEKRISCSIGISISKNNEKDNILKAIKQAVTVLYDIKKAGKNNYKFYE